RLQSLGGVGGRVVDVVMGAELLCQFHLVGATGNRRYLEPHVPGILHTQMTKATDTDHSDKLTGLCRAFRSALNVVSPAQSSGAALTDDRESGIDTRPLAFAIITSA